MMLAAEECGFGWWPSLYKMTDPSNYLTVASVSNDVREAGYYMQSMALVAFYIHRDNLIVEVVNVVAMGVFPISSGNFLVTVAVPMYKYFILLFLAPHSSQRYQQQGTFYPRG
jgi:hypothetical protein